MANNYAGGGNWFGLPELGITELFGGKTGSIDRAVAGDNPGGQLTPYAQQKLNTQSSKTSPGGSTLGASNYTNLMKTGTSAVSNNRDYALQLEQERQAAEKKAREQLIKQTKKSYDPFFSELKRQEAQIPTIESELLGNVNTGFQNQSDVINRGREAGIQQADASAGEVRKNQATSLRDLALNLGNAVSAFGQKLGGMGAGDSSAANMANVAYSKIANRNTADIMNQTRKQLAEIETIKQKIVIDAQDKLSALETWKANQTTAVSQYVRSLRDYISKAKSQGKQALAENEVSAIREGFSRAMERMQQINDLATQSRAAILQNAQTALSEAQSFSQQLNQMGDVQVDPVTGLPIDPGAIAGQQANALPVYGATDGDTNTQSLLQKLLYTA
jgi:hypothetical protein